MHEVADEQKARLVVMGRRPVHAGRGGRRDLRSRGHLHGQRHDGRLDAQRGESAGIVVVDGQDRRHLRQLPSLDADGGGLLKARRRVAPRMGRRRRLAQATDHVGQVHHRR